MFNPPAALPDPTWPSWRRRLNTVIFRADTRLGSVYDWLLIGVIAISVAVVLLDSVAPIRASWGRPLHVVEWSLTLLFTVEYGLRLLTVKRPAAYAVTFFGVIDLISLLPTWLSLVFAGTQVLAVIRVLRMLRVFRLLQVSQLAGEAEALAAALLASATRVTVFLISVLAIVVIMGSVMYLVEGEAAGFDSIPRGIYWAIVTLTTVGYGDIAPATALGQSIAAAIMVLGFAIIAIPTGIVSVALAKGDRSNDKGDEGVSERPCERCGLPDHQDDARYCRRCAAPLFETPSQTAPPHATRTATPTPTQPQPPTRTPPRSRP